MQLFAPICKVDAEQRLVFGYATTEAEDADGETILRTAVEGALDDYLKFANIREMHQNSAVGVAKEATMDERGLYLGAKVVDDNAWKKVVEGVYKGFSIGGRALARDPVNRKVITKLRLSEISLVDRPCNPEAVFDCFKRAAFVTAEDFALATIKATLKKGGWCGDRGMMAFLTGRDRGF